MSQLAHSALVRGSTDHSPWRRIVAAIAALFMVTMSTVALIPVAHANNNNDIVVDGIQIGTGSGDNGQLVIGDTIMVSGTWDASEANPQPGDTFTIGLPPEMNFPANLPFNFTGEDGTVWAQCLTSTATSEVVCTLTDAVVDRPLEVHGTFEFEVGIIGATDAESVVFNLNGRDHSIVVPGDGGISDGIVIVEEWNKTGWMNDNNWSMTWEITIPGSRMVGEDSVTITDTLSDSHILCEPAWIEVYSIRGGDWKNVSSIATIVPSDDPQVFDIVLNPGDDGFDPNRMYRITYGTCTPDGRIDPPGTEYKNTASIDIFGTDGEGDGIGEATLFPGPWHGNTTKNGWVQGGEARNGRIDWLIQIDGDSLAGQNGFNFVETLGEGHEVRQETIDNLRIVEQYGPSGQRRTDITSQLDFDVTSQTASGFEMNVVIKDDSTFKFKPSDFRYQITYSTYVTEEGLPAGGTQYTNEASINGVVSTASPSVPGRSEGKSGWLNGRTVTLDGVEHYPQTTMTWQVRIPGENVEDIVDELVLNDTFNEGHQVCIPGDPSSGVNAQLGLSFQAIDQIDGGGLTTVNLTDSVVTEVSDTGLEFTIPAPTLVQPNGDEATGFSPEYQYLLTYTTCTTSGGMDSAGTTYTNSISGDGVSYSTGFTQWNRGSGTGTGVARGSIEISKFLDESAPGAEFVADGQNFTVHVQEINPAGNVEVEYDLQVPLNGDAVQGLNSRGKGWTVVLTEPTFPDVPGVVFGDPVFTESEGVAVSEDGKTATVSVLPRSNVSVELTNSTELGAITLEKAVEAQDSSIVLPDRTYTVTAHIDTSALGDLVPDYDDITVELTPGEPYIIDDLPIGATVTFSESGLVDDDVLTWADPVFSPSSVVVSKETAQTPATINVQNSVDRTRGTFQVSKTVTGDQAGNPAVPDTITVNATWDEEGTPGEAVLEVPTDGTPVALGHDLYIGTRVTLTEVLPADGSAIAWGTPTWSVDGEETDGDSFTVSVGRDSDATVAIENHADTSVASLELIKTVSGEAAGEISDTTEFPVVATWTDADGEEQSVNLAINAAEATPLGVDLPAGTVVTITEGECPDFSTVDWGDITITGDRVTDNADGSAQVVISDQQGEVALVTVTNEAAWAASSFSISKDLVDNAGAEFVPADTVFTVNVVEYDPEGAAQEPYDLEVPLNRDPVEFSNSFGPGWTAVLTEPTFPVVSGVEFGSPVFTGGEGLTVSADGTSATVAYTPGENVTVQLTNNAQLGSISLVKEVTGGAAEQLAGDAPRTYLVTASINTDGLGDNVPAQEDREITLTAGEPVIIDDLPIGATVTFSEAELIDNDLYTWGEPVFSPESVVVTTDHVTEPAVVTLTNSVERTVGTFQISKTVTGEQAGNPAVPATITINATWDEEGTPGETTLEVPTDGTPVALGYDLLIGTEVTLTEVPLEDGSSIAWAQPAWSGDSVTIDGSSAVVTITRNADAQVTVENHAATSVAGISILKNVSGEAAGEVADDTEFPITATWTDAEGVEQVRELTINSVEPTELGEELPAGTVVTIEEGERPGFDTVIWDDIVIGGEGVTDLGDGRAEIVVSDQQGALTLVTVTNEATWAPGTFTLQKHVEGVPLDNADVPTTVTVVASWIVAEEGEDGEGLVTVTKELEIPTDGTPVAFGEDLPHGTEVTLTEVAPDDAPAFAWVSAEWSEIDGLVMNEDGSATLTISAAQNPTITLTNTAEAILGNLTIVKDVTGSGSDLADGLTYPVTATWADLFGETHVVELDLIAGEPTTIENLPFGTEVTLSEGEFKVPAGVTWDNASWNAVSENVTISGDGREAVITVTDDAGAEASVTLDNEFNAIPEEPVDDTPGTPATPSKPGGNLPWTGANVANLVLWAAILVGAGAAVVYLVRRRNALN